MGFALGEMLCSAFVAGNIVTINMYPSGYMYVCKQTLWYLLLETAY